MMCILKIEGGEVVAWLIGTDTHDLRRQAEAAMWDTSAPELVQELYRLDLVAPGKHRLASGHVLLVS